MNDVRSTMLLRFDLRRPPGPKKKPRLKSRLLERETGFEPATSTLARLHSTTELLPQERSAFYQPFLGDAIKKSAVDVLRTNCGPGSCLALPDLQRDEDGQWCNAIPCSPAELGHTGR